MNYSICYLDKSGRTERSYFDAFEGDAQALTFARGEVPDHAIVEVWKDNHLVDRFFRDPPGAAA